MIEPTDHDQRSNAGLSWAVFFARGVLGLIFFMAGVYKVFQPGPAGHARQWFLPYADTFLPLWSLWVVGYTIPFVELIGGALVLVGWFKRVALISLGCVLLIVTFGHLLKGPLYTFHEHVFPPARAVGIRASGPAGDRSPVGRRNLGEAACARLTMR